MAKSVKGWSNARRKFRTELLSCASGVGKAAQQVFASAGDSFLDFIQANNTLPYYTGNLHDSIAVVISRSGRVARALYMPKEATRAQHAPGRKEIWGMREAISAVRRTSYPRGVCGTLLVSVPYAEGVNNLPKHKGYLDTLESAFAGQMRTALRILSYVKTTPGAKISTITARRFDK